MFHELVSHNPDLKRLVDEGYAVGFDSNYLIVRDVPFLGDQLQLKWGVLVAKLVFIDKHHVRQDDHQVYFAGTSPCGLDGKPIPNLGGGAKTIPLGTAASDVVVERSFSNKPKDGGRFQDFFHKIESYVNIISGPAMAMHGATPHTFRFVDGATPDSVFKFQDTLTSRAEITDLTEKLRSDVIAVIGLGGTGAYLLDFLVKTPVREIRGFDSDMYYVHNAFRSPGRLDQDELNRAKADVYNGRYKDFRSGVSMKACRIDESSGDEVDGVTFAFVCVDKGSSRAGIFNLLLSRDIPFIDVGMGLHRKHGPIGGMIRTTHYSAKDGSERAGQGLSDLNDKPDDVYQTTIQVGELNALNAALALIKYKQLRGFYEREGDQYHLLFTLSDLKLYGGSHED